MSSPDILAKLFGSANRIKLIRLFLLNPLGILPFDEISCRAKISKPAGRREIALLKKIGFIKKKIQGWKLNETFPLLGALKNFVLDNVPLARDRLLKKLQKTGRLKLVILSGIFGGEEGSRVDILVVGDRIRKGALERAIHDVEAEVGKELVYAMFNTEDFLYRFGMYDKFIRDILDYPHEKILDKLGV